MSKSDLKFLVDAGVGKKVKSFISESGYEFKSVREIEHRMKDTEIFLK